MKLDEDYVKKQSFNIASSTSMFLLDDTKITLGKNFDLSKNILSQKADRSQTEEIRQIICCPGIWRILYTISAALRYMPMKKKLEGDI